MDLLSQHEAFLRAIFDAPDDDTPRLVYADFLQENGAEDAAVWIRLECEKARQLSGQERGECSRGFQTPWETMTLTLSQLHDTELFRQYAVQSCPECFAVKGVKLREGQIASAEPFDVLFGLAAFARVTELDLSGNVQPDLTDVGSEFTAYSLSRVITPAGAAALAQHRGLRRITALNLTNNDLDNDAALALVKSPYLDNLKRLRLLEGNRLRGRVWQQVIQRFGEDVVG